MQTESRDQSFSWREMKVGSITWIDSASGDKGRYAIKLKVIRACKHIIKMLPWSLFAPTRLLRGRRVTSGSTISWSWPVRRRYPVNRQARYLSVSVCCGARSPVTLQCKGNPKLENKTIANERDQWQSQLSARLGVSQENSGHREWQAVEKGKWDTDWVCAKTDSGCIATHYWLAIIY